MRPIYAAAAACVALSAALLTLTSGPADASCVSTPVTSRHAFAGVVTDTENRGRVARVRTDDGRTVTVVGTEATGPDSLTTVDRSYEAGTRYEFHPVNGSSPYRDNICTATRALGSAPVLEAADRSVWWIGAGGIAVLALAVGGFLFTRRTRRDPGPDGSGRAS
ncbi:hypothetical protein AB0M43_04320 [Longispora sp. NPDC051575]|uniref:hypothetical protein n=1 Tax=Longispora sp. NPDC051575 TaxID=3154943 RepID=UPI003432C9E0